MTARLRPLMADLPAYTPGRTVKGAIKLASNETVDGPLPGVRAAIDAAADTLNRYPDNGYTELRQHLAKHVDVAPEQIAVGCGSVSLCQQLIQITASVGDEVDRETAYGAGSSSASSSAGAPSRSTRCRSGWPAPPPFRCR